ncbi:2-amino-4-hydroxy-6-hydroxymethyldihydropteridine diphosphokinase [Hyphomonas sp.]|uniref:2-amino-4-hydroxy-6- hydroxymethyldihydropteridine diphosphokinase n=1 Tax=Hyphomonas sp. TaxID=87 RepID=UPI00391B8F3D
MAEAAIGLGSNLGDRAAHLAGAARALAKLNGTRIIAASSLWQTPPVGPPGQQDYYNACLILETALPAEELLAACLAIEATHGRERRERWGPRTLDMDILWYGELVLDTDRLTLPHPRLAERAFVLAPLSEIAPERVVAGQRVTARLEKVSVEGLVRLGSFPCWDQRA